jgi:cytochrome P450
VPSNARFLSEDLVLENFLVEKGTLVNLCNSYITKSDRFFKNPAKFDPTRWEREDTEINPYSTLAFGFGARMCVGRRVAEQEIYLTIVKILQNYKLEYHETIPEIKIGLLATPNKPLNIVFNKRH